MLEWRDSYNVEIRSIDKQHRKILDIVNRLYALQSGKDREKDRERMKRIFVDLLRYIDAHFTAEERLMREYGYPGYAEQKAAHDALIDRVCDLLKAFLKNKGLVEINVFNFVWDWFAGHILKMDRLYSPYLKDHKAG
jgi:hemerythrin